MGKIKGILAFEDAGSSVTIVTLAVRFALRFVYANFKEMKLQVKMLYLRYYTVHKNGRPFILKLMTNADCSSHTDVFI